MADLKGQVSPDTKDNLYSSVLDKGFDASSDEISLEAKPQQAGETFAQGGQTRFYKPIDAYEGRHRWDPNAEWTEKEEKLIVRKVSTQTSACLLAKLIIM